MWSDDLKLYVWRFEATRIIKICLNVNLCKSEGFLTSIQCIPIPEYGQSNAP